MIKIDENLSSYEPYFLVGETNQKVNEIYRLAVSRPHGDLIKHLKQMYMGLSGSERGTDCAG